MDNINNISKPPENNKPKYNIFIKAKIFFANSFRTISSLFTTKKNIKIADKAKDIIPENAGVVGDIDIKNINDLKKTDPKTKKQTNYTLGKGSYGEVKIVAPQHKTKKIFPVVIQKQFIDDIGNNIKASNEVKLEHGKNKDFKNYSILDEKNNSIISKYKGDSLKTLLDPAFHVKTGGFSDEIKKSICYQLLKEINTLHQQGILHQDLKPDNILIDAKGKLSIIDLAGASQNSDKRANYAAKYDQSLITVTYAAPERQYKNAKMTQYFDCWSAGAIMYEICTGKKLLAHCIQKDAQGNELFNENKFYDELIKVNNKLANSTTIPPRIKKLIFDLLSIDPNDRPTIEQALNYSVFADKNNINKMTAMDLNITHDEHFKKLVKLEVDLEAAEKKGDEISVARLKEKITIEKKTLVNLQKEINKKK